MTGEQGFSGAPVLKTNETEAAITEEAMQVTDQQIPKPTWPRDTSRSPGAGRAKLGALARDMVLRFGMVWVLIALALLANALYPGFFAPGNLNNMVGQVAPVGIIALGMTYVIVAGGFDLSVGAIFAGATVFYASFSNHMPLWAAFACTVLIAIVAGTFNGLIITRVKVNPFIATLATSSLFGGATYLYSNATPIVSNNGGFQTLGTGKWAGIWISIYVLVALLIVAAIVLSRTTYGRSIFAIGGNQEAARLAGMRTDAIRVSTFMITGACAAVAGMIVASQTGVGQANVGSTVTLDSIAIVIIGGTSLMGGEGAIWRTAVGILIWGTINNLFSSLALSTSAQLLMQGAIVLVAVALDSFSTRRRG
jgi:ribose transport system permease protein